MFPVFSLALPDLPHCLCPAVGLSLKKVFLMYLLLRVSQQTCWPQQGGRTQVSPQDGLKMLCQNQLWLKAVVFPGDYGTLPSPLVGE